MANAPEIRDTFRLLDKKHIEADALPTADGTSYSTGIDLGALTVKGARLADMELVLKIPDLSVTHLPDADTLTFSLLGDTALPIDGSSIVVQAAVLSMLGAGGVGDGPEEKHVKIPSDFSYRYLGIKAVAAGGTGDISAVDMTTQLVF